MSQPFNLRIHQHRGVDIVVGRSSSDYWQATWKFPGEDEPIHARRPSESAALSYAKTQIDRSLDGAPQPMPVVVWWSGEDSWSGIDIENGVMPSDAMPYAFIGDEWQPLN